MSWVLLAVQGHVHAQATKGDSLRKREKGCEQRSLQEPSCTTCSTSQLHCAALAGTCFSINLGGRESLAEPGLQGRIYSCSGCSVLSLQGWGSCRNTLREEEEEKEEMEEGAHTCIDPGDGVPARPGQRSRGLEQAG